MKNYFSSILLLITGLFAPGLSRAQQYDISLSPEIANVLNVEKRQIANALGSESNPLKPEQKSSKNNQPDVISGNGFNTDQPLITATFSVSPNTLHKVGDILQFNPSISGGTPPYSLLWNFGDSNSGVFNSSTSYTPSHVFANQGVFSVKMTVTDNSLIPQTKIYSNTVNVASFTSVSSCDFTADLLATSPPNNTVTLSASGTTAWGSLNYNWSCTEASNTSNPVTATGQVANVTLPIGTWHVKLTVSNGTNNCSVTKSSYIKVTAATNSTIELGPIGAYGVCHYQSQKCYLTCSNITGGIRSYDGHKDIKGNEYFYKEYYWQAVNLQGTGFLPNVILQSGDGCYQPNYNLCAQPQINPSLTLPFFFKARLQITDYNYPTPNVTVREDIIRLYPDLKTNLPAEIIVCPGTDITLNPIISGGTGPGTYRYFWSAADISNSPNIACSNCLSNVIKAPNVSGNSAIYEFKVKDTRNLCQWEIFNVKVIAKDISVTDINEKICFGTGKSIHVIATGGSGVYTYSWSPSTGLNQTNISNPTITPVSIGSSVYTVTVLDANGCSNVGHVYIQCGYSNPIVNLGPDQIICKGEDVKLSPTVTNGGGLYSYLWSSGHTASSVTYNPMNNQTFTVSVTDQATDCVRSDQVDITIKDPGAAPLIIWPEAFLNICKGSASVLSPIIQGGTPPFTYKWEPTNSLNDPTIIHPIATPTGSTVYFITVTDANGCTGVKSKSYWCDGKYLATARYVYDQFPDGEVQVSSPNICQGILCFLDFPKFYSLPIYTHQCFTFGAGGDYLTASLPATYSYTFQPAGSALQGVNCVNLPVFGENKVQVTVNTPCGSRTFQSTVFVAPNNFWWDSPASLTIFQSSDYNKPLKDQNNTKFFGAKFSMQASKGLNSVQVANGSLYALIAGEEVVLMPGFTAVQGSNLIVAIRKCQ